MNSNSFVQEVNDGIYTHVGLQQAPSPENGGDMSVFGFIVGNNEVAVVDSGHSVSLGEQLLQAIHATTDKPINHLILTHLHPDHIFGASVFTHHNKDITVWAHANYTAQMEHIGPYYLEGLSNEIGDAAKGAQLVRPTRMITEAQPVSLDLGGRTVRLEAWPTAHTNNDVTVLDEKTDSFIASDLLFDERIPILAGSLLGWRRVLQEIKQRQHAMIIPGHGNATTGTDSDELIGRLDGYFSVLESDIKRILKEGGDIQQATETAAKTEKNKWLLFDLYNGRNAINAFKELEWL